MQYNNRNYPFMTCVLKVNTRSSSWQRTVRRVLKKCHGVRSFRMNDNGFAEICGTVDPNVLLKMLEKEGGKAELHWFQFGECSSNLFPPSRSSIQGYSGGTNYSYDGRHYGHHQNYKPHHQLSYHDHSHGYDHRWNGHVAAEDSRQYRCAQNEDCCIVM